VCSDVVWGVGSGGERVAGACFGFCAVMSLIALSCCCMFEGVFVMCVLCFVVCGEMSVEVLVQLCKVVVCTWVS
jgi:hypothetical protein